MFLVMHIEYVINILLVSSDRQSIFEYLCNQNIINMKNMLQGHTHELVEVLYEYQNMQ